MKVKKKLKIKNFIIFLCLFILIGLIIFLYMNHPIKVIYIKGNNLLTEQEILDLGKLNYYPKNYEYKKQEIINHLLKSDLIKNVEINKTFNGELYINIEEYKIICNTYDNETILSNGKKISKIDSLGYPVLINEIDDKLYDEFVEKFSLINSDILLKISEIKYDPNEQDKNRFSLYMVDKNLVYVTLSKIKSINSYNDIVPTLENKIGILYLDEGNYFEIKK